MCFGCWENAGWPRIDNGKVRDAVELIRAVYEINFVGGNLHCQLDDWNVDDTFWEPDRKDNEAERRCRDHFRAMTEQERYSALALEAGFWRTKEE